MSEKSAIVLVIDGLSARFLGPYANTWFGTDQFDRLAGNSMLAEFAFTDSTELLGSYRSLWGLKPKFSGIGSTSAEPVPQDNELVKQLAQLGIQSTLLTDDQELGDCEPLVSQFDRVVSNPSLPVDVAAESESETRLATFFASALQHASRIGPGEMLWLHSSGLSTSWDAPYELRQHFAEEEDPDPPTFVDPPRVETNTGELDPDELLGYQQACAAQIVLLDRFLGILLDQLATIPEAERPFFVLTSTRGFPLGANRFVGQPEKSLFDDATHVPLFACWPDGKNGMQRNQSLVYSSVAGPLLLDWFGREEREQSDKSKNANGAGGTEWLDSPLAKRESEFVFSAAGNERSLRTHGWKLMSDGEEQHLFVKPDDRWDLNDVIRKCRNVGEQMLELTETIESEIQLTGQPKVRELPEELAANLQ